MRSGEVTDHLRIIRQVRRPHPRDDAKNQRNIRGPSAAEIDARVWLQSSGILERSGDKGVLTRSNDRVLSIRAYVRAHPDSLVFPHSQTNDDFAI